MESSLFQALDPLADELAKRGQDWLESDELASLRKALEKLSGKLGEPYSFEIAVELRVFDSDREQSVRLLTLSRAVSAGESFTASGDSAPQRYLLDGNVCEIPDDYCPRCWGDWGFKLQHRTCPHCQATLGGELRLLLDDDVCPFCKRGEVTLAKPHCTACEFVAEPPLVAWG